MQGYQYKKQASDQEATTYCLDMVIMRLEVTLIHSRSYFKIPLFPSLQRHNVHSQVKIHGSIGTQHVDSSTLQGVQTFEECTEIGGVIFDVTIRFHLVIDVTIDDPFEI